MPIQWFARRFEYETTIYSHENRVLAEILEWRFSPAPTHRIHIVLDGLVRRGEVPCQIRDILKSCLDVLDALYHCSHVVLVIQVRLCRHDGVQARGDSHSAPRDGTPAEVHAHRNRLAVRGSKAAFDPRRPLELTGYTVGPGDCFEESIINQLSFLRSTEYSQGADIWRSLGQDADSII